MKNGEQLVIFGASARAAAFSAVRAELRPWCADLFADRDLQTLCSVRRIAEERYPREFVQIETQAPAGPWMFTGGLENRRPLIRAISRRRPLWGCDPKAVRKARSPRFLSNLLGTSGQRYPRVCKHAVETPKDGKWLVKPRSGAGGTAIRFLGHEFPHRHERRVYFQEYIEGEPYSAVYIAGERSTPLLGVTRQLVGEPWLHAAPFHYCGSVGPVALDPTVDRTLRQLGEVLVNGCGLRGLFGVDYIVRDGIPWPVEVNPRYTASIEVLEHALGIFAVDEHRHVFEPHHSRPIFPQTSIPPALVGKAILFARSPLVFPADGPWEATLAHAAGVTELPAFADIPAPGEPIAAGRPILAFFTRAGTVAACLDALQRIAADLDCCLFGA